MNIRKILFAISTVAVVSCGGSKDEPVKPTPEPAEVKIPAWIELPATSATDGYDFFTHSAQYEGKTVRSWSFYWDYTNFVAQWVAYPQTRNYQKGDAGRTEAWGLDPLLARNQQPVIIKGFQAGSDTWKSRGHQIASADRQYSNQMNAQTYYGTNMTPQINDNFNGGVWAELEKGVRAWATGCDTAYVVTGCVTKGASTYVLDNDGKHITVPTGYYKAVVCYSKDETFGINGYMGAAFYFEHKEYPKYSIKVHAMSIDDLEEQLGIDFFVNLPAAAGGACAAQVEAQDPTTVDWWWTSNNVTWVKQ
ncbi:MAG: DNA/RNA non-specific endonuclease [Bacteroidales bacterium]|nr:DNA/RNA non-specific endonuclease [Bacteroidales bacterium]